MDYVIWGCGGMGKQVLRLLEETQRVVAIVEGNEKLHGSTYCGIPIISFEEFLLKFSEYPIIVTPLFYQDEIMEQLKLKNIIGAFPFIKERGQVESLLFILPINQTLTRYKDKGDLAIYGVSLLGLLLYDLFFKNGFPVSLVKPSSTEPALEKYVREILKLKMISVDDVKKSNMRLLLAAELEENDQNKLHGVTYDKFYDLHLHEELFYHPELEQFKNIHEGKRCFIVATGPSLRMDDLDTLYNNEEICISVNGIFKAFNMTKWRPNYYVIADPNKEDSWENEILEMDVQAKFVSDVAPYFINKCYDNIYKWHLIRKMDDQGFPYFSDDFARGGYYGDTVIYEGAMQLAVYMGFREIYLLGTDCTVSADGTVPHFVADYAEDPGFMIIDDRMRAYQAAKQYADSHDIKIYNATRGGRLEIFPRIDFDALFH